MKLSSPVVALAKIDATAEKDLATKYGVSGYPTLKWVSKGTASEFTGGRTDPEIVSWCLRRSGHSITELNSLAEVYAFRDKHDAVAILFGKNSETS